MKLTQNELESTTQFSTSSNLSTDFIEAVEMNFPHVQCPPDWSVITQALNEGFLLLHELRDCNSKTLLSARLICNYISLFRGDISFALACYAVTPSPQSDSETPVLSQRGKSKGYGTYLFQRSLELLKAQMPHALGLVGECEAPSGANSARQNKRLRWLSSIGRARIAELDYEIPPLPKALGAHLQALQERGRAIPGQLLITPFSPMDSIKGTVVARIVERLYTAGYGISPTDPYLSSRLRMIDKEKNYRLI